MVMSPLPVVVSHAEARPLAAIAHWLTACGSAGVAVIHALPFGSTVVPSAGSANISTSPPRSVSTTSKDGASPSATSSRTMTSTVIEPSESGDAATAETLVWTVAHVMAMVSAMVVGVRMAPTTEPAGSR